MEFFPGHVFSEQDSPVQASKHLHLGFDGLLLHSPWFGLVHGGLPGHSVGDSVVFSVVDLVVELSLVLVIVGTFVVGFVATLSSLQSSPM